MSSAAIPAAALHIDAAERGQTVLRSAEDLMNYSSRRPRRIIDNSPRRIPRRSRVRERNVPTAAELARSSAIALSPPTHPHPRDKILNRIDKRFGKPLSPSFLSHGRSTPSLSREIPHPLSPPTRPDNLLSQISRRRTHSR